MVVFPLKAMPDPDVPGLMGWAQALLGQNQPLLVGEWTWGPDRLSEVPKYSIFFKKTNTPFSQDALGYK